MTAEQIFTYYCSRCIYRDKCHDPCLIVIRAVLYEGE